MTATLEAPTRFYDIVAEPPAETEPPMVPEPEPEPEPEPAPKPIRRRSPIQKVLDEAADLLEREGWVQGTYHNIHGYCSIGAVRQVLGCEANYHAYSSRRYRAALKVLARRAAQQDGYSLQEDHEPSEVIINWNDSGVRRTKEEVIATFRGR